MYKQNSTKTVALIPARGGSKRVSGKNMRMLNGKPLIVYTIDAAKEAKRVDRIIVSTDDERIADIARAHGAEVPFLRPKELAQDDTPDRPVLIHAIRKLHEENYTFDTIAFLRPTTPFKSSKIIDKAIDVLKDNPGFHSLRTVTAVEGVFHPYWMFRDKSGLLQSFVDGVDIKKYYQRQLLPLCYRLNGVVDILRVGRILKNNDLYGKRIGFLKVNENVAIDIDTEFDFMLAEFMMKNQ